jgi:hypothetical protein
MLEEATGVADPLAFMAQHTMSDVAMAGTDDANREKLMDAIQRSGPLSELDGRVGRATADGYMALVSAMGSAPLVYDVLTKAAPGLGERGRLTVAAHMAAIGNRAHTKFFAILDTNDLLSSPLGEPWRHEQEEAIIMGERSVDQVFQLWIKTKIQDAPHLDKGAQERILEDVKLLTMQTPGLVGTLIHVFPYLFQL